MKCEFACNNEATKIVKGQRVCQIHSYERQTSKSMTDSLNQVFKDIVEQMQRENPILAESRVSRMQRMWKFSTALQQQDLIGMAQALHITLETMEKLGYEELLDLMGERVTELMMSLEGDNNE